MTKLFLIIFLVALYGLLCPYISFATTNSFKLFFAPKNPNVNKYTPLLNKIYDKNYEASLERYQEKLDITSEKNNQPQSDDAMYETVPAQFDDFQEFDAPF